MNYIMVQIEHTYFYSSIIESFECIILDKKVKFDFEDYKNTIYVYGNEELEQLRKFCLEICTLIYIYLGSFPHIEKMVYNDTEQDLGILAGKYNADKRYEKNDLVIVNINNNTINENTYIKFEDVLGIPIYSLQYLVSNNYEKIGITHRITLLLHVIEGLVDKPDKINDYKKMLVNKYNIPKDKMPGNFFVATEKVLDVFFEKDVLFNADVLNVLGKNKYEFLETITDTRNWYSHFWKSKEKNGKLKTGKEMVIYFDLVYYCIRLYIVSLLEVDACDDLIKSPCSRASA